MLKSKHTKLVFMFGVVEYATLTVFLLKIFLRGLPGGKHWSMMVRNSLATFVLNVLLKGGLNHKMGHFLPLFLGLGLFLWGSNFSL